jgi:hypothetical protein
LVGAAVLIGKCIYHYSLNEDLTLTTYTEFHSDKDKIYPSISLCFGNLFKKEELAKYGVTKFDYANFLKGNNYSEGLSKIPYQNVTLNPIDYLLGIQIYQTIAHKRKNEKVHYWYDFTGANKTRNIEKLDLYVDQFNDWWGTLYKCMTLDVPYIANEHLNRVVLLMKRSIFKDGKRPQFLKNSKDGFDLFLVSLSYPQQRLRYSNEKITWGEEVTNQSYVVKYVVSTVEVLQFRNKKSKPCNEEWRVDDVEIKNTIIRNQK